MTLQRNLQACFFLLSALILLSLVHSYVVLSPDFVDRINRQQASSKKVPTEIETETETTAQKVAVPIVPRPYRNHPANEQIANPSVLERSEQVEDADVSPLIALRIRRRFISLNDAPRALPADFAPRNIIARMSAMLKLLINTAEQQAQEDRPTWWKKGPPSTADSQLQEVEPDREEDVQGVSNHEQWAHSGLLQMYPKPLEQRYLVSPPANDQDVWGRERDAPHSAGHGDEDKGEGHRDGHDDRHGDGRGRHHRYESCRADLSRFCPSARVPSEAWDVAGMMECLSQHESQLSTHCKVELSSCASFQCTADARALCPMELTSPNYDWHERKHAVRNCLEAVPQFLSNKCLTAINKRRERHGQAPLPRPPTSAEDVKSNPSSAASPAAMSAWAVVAIVSIAAGVLFMSVAVLLFIYRRKRQQQAVLDAANSLNVLPPPPVVIAPQSVGVTQEIGLGMPYYRMDEAHAI